MNGAGIQNDAQPLALRLEPVFALIAMTPCAKRMVVNVGNVCVTFTCVLPTICVGRRRLPAPPDPPFEGRAPRWQARSVRQSRRDPH